MVLASASGLTACAVSPPSANAPILLPALPQTVAGRCAPPVALPDHALTQAEVETLWSRDRAALVKCGWSKGALLDFYADLAARFRAADRSKGE